MKYVLRILVITACAITSFGQGRNDNLAIKQIDPAKWWVVPFSEGNTKEGKLYFGSLLENRSNKRLILIITFRAYKADGTLFDACSDGVSVDIAPREKAFVVCHRTIVSSSIKNLQITSRITYIRPLVAASSFSVSVIDSGLITKQAGLEDSIYQAFALIKANGNRDTYADLLFRFYDGNNVQISTSGANASYFEPEVARKIVSLPVIIDAGSPPPKRVRVDVKAYAEN